MTLLLTILVGAGVVRAVGPDVRDVAVGDHVLLSYSYCRHCRSCKRGRPYQCTRMFERNFVSGDAERSQGVVWNGAPIHASFFGQSSFSNPAIVQEECCVRINKEYPLEVLAPLGCGAQTGAGCIFNVVKPIENDIRSLVVFGIGGVGSAAIMAARALHIDHPEILTTIIAVDREQDRLALAKELGATNVIQSSNMVDDLTEIRRIVPEEGTDAVVDCTGALPVINAMASVLGAGGIAVSLGVPPADAAMSIHVFPFVNGCKRYQASNQGNSVSKTVRPRPNQVVLLSLSTVNCVTQFLPFLADLYMQNRFPIDRLQRQYRPSEINTTVQHMLEGTTMKPVIIWS